MDLGQSIRKGVKWLIIGNTGQRLLEFAFGVVLARLLVPADFGYIVTIQVFTGFVGMLTTGGMGQALVRAKSVNRADFHGVFTLQLGISILVYLGFFLVAPWFARFFENAIYQDLLRVSALSFFLRPFANMHIAWLNREMDFRTRTLITVTTGIVTGISSILMALAGWGAWSLVFSGLLGGLVTNLLLSRVTPLEPRLNFDLSVMRRHSAYGSKIVGNDILGHIRREGLKVVISKLAGPAVLGLFNKADSLHRLPYRMLGQPVAQPLFRAMARVQDDLDQTKYMYYRAVTLLTVYVLPFFVGILWVAQPFILVVYGEKWIEAGKPMSIMALSGIFYIIARPCGAVLMAQNRLGWEMIAQAAILAFTLTACILGLRWGLEGVSWGYVLSQAFAAAVLYALAHRILPTRLGDLARALAPGLLLNGLLMATLALVHLLSGQLVSTSPALYILLMGAAGGTVYVAAFLLLPIAALQTEANRWNSLLAGSLQRLRRRTA